MNRIIMSLLALAPIPAATNSYSQDSLFVPPVSYGAGDGPSSVFSADLDSTGTFDPVRYLTPASSDIILTASQEVLKAYTLDESVRKAGKMTPFLKMFQNIINNEDLLLNNKFIGSYK